jgi:signal peptidase I
MSGDGAVGRGSLDPTDAAFIEVVTDLLRRGHSVRFRARGGSMRPTIREGEAITVAPAPSHGIRRGDVILYRSARGVIAHRVVRVARRPNGTRAFVPRGDASQSRDEAVEETAILGRVVTVERNGRTLNPASTRVRALATGRAVAVRILRWFRFRPRDA